jgi:hypothetical protein
MLTRSIDRTAWKASSGQIPPEGAERVDSSHSQKHLISAGGDPILPNPPQAG